MVVNGHVQDDGCRRISLLKNGLHNSIGGQIDHLNRLAARILHTPDSLIVCNDAIDGATIHYCDVDRENAPCDARITEVARSLGRTVINSVQPLAVTDLRVLEPAGPRTLEGGAEVASYLGVPLIGMESNGYAVGALCVIDWVPRNWTEEEVRNLEAVGEVVARQVADLAAAEMATKFSQSGPSGLAADGDRGYDELLSVLGHELKTPLAAILSAIHLARQTGVEESELAWAHNVVDRQGRRIVGLIDDLLDVSRLDRAKIHLDKQLIFAVDVVHRAVAAVRPHVENKQLDLVVAIAAESLALHADPKRTEQLLVNLLKNAIRSSNEGGRITLRVDRAEAEAVFLVSDEGAGISADNLPHAFELIPRASTPCSHAPRCLAVELALVKKLATVHGGRVEAASDGPDLGSRFTVRLPLWEEPQTEGDQCNGVSRCDGPGAKLRILVVDDNVDGAAALAMLLSVSGHHVRTAYNGDVAVEIALDQRPEAILLDIGLPGRDGYSVAKTLRQDARCRDSFIIALSGYGLEEDRMRSRDAGFDAHLTKPIDVDDLLAMLAKSRSRVRDEDAGLR